MNLVRLGMIVTLGVVAWYALTVYAAIPPGEVVTPALSVSKTVEVMCPTVTNGASGVGAITIALAAIVGTIAVGVTDLVRRVY